MRKLFHFNGGVHPPQHKVESVKDPIRKPPLPEKLVIPLHQHIGTAAKVAVMVGERVLKGQKIGEATGNVSSAIHAPTSGKVLEIGNFPVAHPSGLSELCVTIAPDGMDEAAPFSPVDPFSMDPAEIRKILRDSGVVGLGGAVFPSAIKLNPGREKQVRTLVLNGAECEPYITCDDLLMRERADEIVKGAQIMRHLLHAEEVIVGIEDNKPEAIAAMKQAAGDEIEVVAVPTLYPGGGAKQLIRVLTGIEVPAGERSTDLGVQCFNVATAYTVYRAIACGEPVTSRIVTVTGNVKNPGNYEALIGTPMDFLIGLSEPLEGSRGALMGGPMMGFDLPSVSVPVVKATNCIIVKSEKLFPAPPTPMPCIRCGRCAASCPADLQPQELYWFAKAGNFGKAQEYSLFDCIECGCCSYVCPSHIPLVQFYRYAKSEIWAQEREKKSSDIARVRHEFRIERTEREKREKAERLAQKAAQTRAQIKAEENS
ncbi:MAG: electron transport complex subunit RsxC [Burkholderiales bacterium]|nr:electron transport complex subunit RsxC [Burkholderiales bacterium]